jgi:phosphatidylethanolamine/phosphatidyl-N-methylethanolamine N-methyltransferase
MTSQNLFLFFRALAAAPRTVGAIAPSGPQLAKLITQDIGPGTGPVLELGPGTGSLTQAILKRGVREGDLTLIEYGSDFMRILQARFPRARILWMDAAWIDRENLFPDRPFGAVVSGLPLLNIPARKLEMILTGIFNSVRDDASLYQFTYGIRCPIPHEMLEKLGLQASCMGRVLANVPPASVYRITRAADFGEPK